MGEEGGEEVGGGGWVSGDGCEVFLARYRRVLSENAGGESHSLISSYSGEEDYV